MIRKVVETSLLSTLELAATVGILKNFNLYGTQDYGC